MLTQHLYLFVASLASLSVLTYAIPLRNLDAFQGGLNDTLNHVLRVDADKVIELDGNAIPTGKFINVEGTVFDFRTPKAQGAQWNQTQGLCRDRASFLVTHTETLN